MSTIDGLLLPGGRAILVQPQRGGTADLFVRRVSGFNFRAEEGGFVGVSDGQRGQEEGKAGEGGGHCLAARLVER